MDVEELTTPFPAFTVTEEPSGKVLELASPSALLETPLEETQFGPVQLLASAWLRLFELAAACARPPELLLVAAEEFEVALAAVLQGSFIRSTRSWPCAGNTKLERTNRPIDADLRKGGKGTCDMAFLLEGSPSSSKEGLIGDLAAALLCQAWRTFIALAAVMLVLLMALLVVVSIGIACGAAGRTNARATRTAGRAACRTAARA